MITYTPMTEQKLQDISERSRKAYKAWYAIGNILELVMVILGICVFWGALQYFLGWYGVGVMSIAGVGSCVALCYNAEQQENIVEGL